MKLYAAGGIFNNHQISVMSEIAESARELGYDVFSPYEASRSIWRGRKPSECSEAERRQVIQGNRDNMNDAAVLVAWVNSGDIGKVDTGVAWEMGYCQALGLDEPEGLPFTIGYIHPYDPLPGTGVNLMLAGTMDALCCTIMELRDALKHLTSNSLGEGESVWDEVRERYNPERLAASLHEQQSMVRERPRHTPDMR